MEENEITRIEITIEKPWTTTITFENQQGLRETRPVALSDITRTIHRHVSRTIYLASEVIATDWAETVAWWRPPQIQAMVLQHAGGAQGIYRLPMPGLLLRLKLPHTIAVAAVKGSRRPLPSAPVFHAPLPNIDDRSGRVCLGATQLTCQEEAVLEIDPQQVWQDFWGSAFNQHAAANRCKTYPKDVRLLLFELQGKSRFPPGELLATGDHVESWLEL